MLTQAHVARRARLALIVRARPRDGDGDGFYSPRKGLPDRTPVPRVPEPALKAAVAAARATPRPPARPVSVRTLLAAPHHAQTAVLRDVYETSAGGLTARVGRVAPLRDGSLAVSGRIVDSRGREVGKWRRTIYQPGPDGTFVSHDRLELDPPYRGRGFSKAFNDRAIQWYRASGIDAVSLSATDVGTYTWPAYGFDFAHEEVAMHALTNLHALIAALRSGRRRVDLDGVRADIPAALAEAPDLEGQLAEADRAVGRAEHSEWGQAGFPSARELSRVGRRGRAGTDAMWLGKFLMLHTAFEGVLWLTGDGRGA